MDKHQKSIYFYDLVVMFPPTDSVNIYPTMKETRLYCAQIVGWINAPFDNIDDERRLFNGFFKKYE